MRRVNVVLLLLIVLLTMTPVFAQTMGHKAVMQSQIAEVFFKHLLPLAEVDRLASDHQLNLLLLESDFVIGSLNLHDFYIVKPGTSRDSVETDYTKERLAFFADMVNESGRTSEDQRRRIEPALLAMKQALRQQDVGQIQISKAKFFGSSGQLTKMTHQASTIIATVEVTDPAKQAERQRMERERHPQLYSNRTPDDVRSAASTSWYPDVGESLTYPSSHGGRYTMQWMKWETSDFNELHTYEHEYFLYNYDGATYFDASNTGYPSCFPKVTYAATTWSADARPYLDTREPFPWEGGFRCEWKELEFTIGAAQAKNLSVHTWEYNYVRTNNGNTNSSRFKLSSQRGHRTPSWCYSVWCSFDGDGRKILVPAWSDAVPGYRSWYPHLALGTPSYNSSSENEQHSAKKGNDGDFGTRWSSGHSHGSEWWFTNLEQSQTFDRVIIWWEAAYAAEHCIIWWNYGDEYADGYCFNINAPGGYAYYIGTRTASNVAVLMNRHAGYANFSFWELFVDNSTTIASIDSKQQTNVQTTIQAHGKPRKLRLPEGMSATYQRYIPLMIKGNGLASTPTATTVLPTLTGTTPSTPTATETTVPLTPTGSPPTVEPTTNSTPPAQPTLQLTSIATPTSGAIEPTPDTTCDVAYPDVCIPSPPPNLNCADILYREFRVLPPDPHGFDIDSDGIGCERDE